jgi:hypothetical protein
VDRDERIVVGGAARPDLGSWNAHLRPAAGYRLMGLVMGPLVPLFHNARYAKPSVFNSSEKFVITPGIPLPPGCTARPGYCGIDRESR